MNILGIDPGLSGSLAFLDEKEILIYDIPTFEIVRNGKNKRQIDLQALLGILKLWPVDHAYLERVGAMPGQGVSSMFSMGKTVGHIEMALAACNIPVTQVTPQVWKKSLQVPKEKEGARMRASQLMPQWAHNWPLKKHSDRAESALLALWGRQQKAPT